MNALNSKFRFCVSFGGQTLEVYHRDDFQIYPTGPNSRFGEDLTRSQIDLLRISAAVHLADSWAKRSKTFNGVRNIVVNIEVLEPKFWSSSSVSDKLVECISFVSGGDEWEFVFTASKDVRHEQYLKSIGKYDRDVIVAPYSGGLDSAAGLAIRANSEKGKTIVPVTVRFQSQKARLFRDHFEQLIKSGVVERDNLEPFEAGSFNRRRVIKIKHDKSLSETTHRCRPMLFMVCAGLVARLFSQSHVEVYESGVGALNLPLLDGPSSYLATRSTHPNFLRLISALMSEVNQSEIRYILPFVNWTKAEMVSEMKKLGLEDLARRSFSCILHPLKRNGWQQCGTCPACVFRRQAMLTAGIREKMDAYAIDLFGTSDQALLPSRSNLAAIHFFHDQVSRLRPLDDAIIPPFFRRHLWSTGAVSSEEEIAAYAEVYHRYRQEWLKIIDVGRRSRMPWLLKNESRDFRKEVGS
jgi:7-cyano-7-deazaguanine synthase in queuosine biosynthesis